MRVRLVGITKPTTIVLEELPVLIGKAPETDVRLSDSAQGNYHCLINWIEGDLVLRDLGTGGATFVNGIPVTKTSLKEGDTLKLGSTEFSVRYERNPQRYLLGVRC